MKLRNLVLLIVLLLVTSGFAPVRLARCPGGPVQPIPIALSVTLQRPNAPPPHPSWAVPVRFVLYPIGDPDTVCHEWGLTLDESGRWSGSLAMVPGLYDVRIKNVHTLRNVQRNADFSRPMIINMGELHEGDANDDNRIRITDFGILRNAYFTNEGDLGFDPRADFDENGCIDARDFDLLRANYFLSGDMGNK